MESGASAGEGARQPPDGLADLILGGWRVWQVAVARDDLGKPVYGDGSWALRLVHHNWHALALSFEHLLIVGAAKMGIAPKVLPIKCSTSASERSADLPVRFTTRPRVQAPSTLASLIVL